MCMLQSIAGTYKDGVVQLMEAPANIQESKVIVIFVDSTHLDPAVSKSTLSQEDNIESRQPRPFGLCAGEFTVPADFNEPLPEEILSAFEGK